MLRGSGGGHGVGGKMNLTHEHAYSLFQRHVMGITAAQFVWEPLEDKPAGEDHVQQSASSSAAATTPRGRHPQPKEREFQGRRHRRPRDRDKSELLFITEY